MEFDLIREFYSFYLQMSWCSEIEGTRFASEFPWIHEMNVHVQFHLRLLEESARANGAHRTATIDSWNRVAATTDDG